jgi:hypothetical protein
MGDRCLLMGDTVCQLKCRSGQMNLYALAPFKNLLTEGSRCTRAPEDSPRSDRYIARNVILLQLPILPSYGVEGMTCSSMEFKKNLTCSVSVLFQR